MRKKKFFYGLLFILAVTVGIVILHKDVLDKIRLK